ncbi:hypothetical protein [Halorubrum californiense]|uniref:hypothetical protein n=1 Tax=Halorubrum californiense TaxID=416585 RepID=UPI001267F64A|nr:hypothetical protein [Halorubrum californiense]
MVLDEFINNSDRPLTDEQAEATDEIFDRFAPASDYRDQVVAEFLDLDPVPLHAQRRTEKLPVEVDRARRAIRNVANVSNRTESNIEQRVKQVYDGPGEKETEIARFAEDLKQIESQL